MYSPAASSVDGTLERSAEQTHQGDNETIQLSKEGRHSMNFDLEQGFEIPRMNSSKKGGPQKKQRRGSLVNTSRRYSDGNIATYEAFFLSSTIFDIWDVEEKGYVTPDQVKFDGINPQFCTAIARMVGFGAEGKITIEHVAECISILKYGNMQSKVKMLVQFMDHDGNGEVSYNEIKEYLRVADDKMMDRLGLTIQQHIHTNSSSEALPSVSGNKPKSVLTYEDILSLFQVSDRGNEAMTVFCDQILRILSTTCANRARSPEELSRRNSMQISLSDHHPGFGKSAYDWCKTQVLAGKRYLQHVSQVQIFKAFLVCLQIFLWLFYFFYHKNRGFPLAFCFAKGFGLNLRILSLLVYFTMARTTMGHLYTMKLVRPIIPLGINIEVHSFIGFCIVMHAFGHTFAHIAYKEMHTTPGFETAFTQNSLLRGNNWEQKLKGDGKTGFILLALLIVMAGTALFRAFSAVRYKWFYFSHFLYLLYLPMLFLHIPQLWPYFLSITVLMVLERSYDLFQNTLYTTLAASRPCANGITFLSIPRYGMQTYPGSYYRIRIPSISSEWHPFSLAGTTSSHRLYFFIASAGDWTRSLYSLVSDPSQRPLTLVQVQGPFLAPASQALIRKPNARILCVASGIGITPFFSLMATKVSDEVNFDNERQMYRALFADSKSSEEQSTAVMPSTSPSKLQDERNSLLQIWMQQRKLLAAQEQQQQQQQNNSNGNSIVASKENSGSSLLSTIISAARRNTNSNILGPGGLLGSTLTSATPATDANPSPAALTALDNQDHNNPHEVTVTGNFEASVSPSPLSSTTPTSVSRAGSHSNFIQIFKQGNSSSHTSKTNVLMHGVPPTSSGTEASTHIQLVDKEKSDIASQLEMVISSKRETDEKENEEAGGQYRPLPSLPETELVFQKQQEDHHQLLVNSNPSREKHSESVLKVVWSIRELSELSFYVDYVHHLVKAQEQLLTSSDDDSDLEEGHDDDGYDDHDDEGGDHRRDDLHDFVQSLSGGVDGQQKYTNNKRQKRNKTSKKRHGRVVVEVEVFLTGLGSTSDPVFMLSQTLFLLSIAHTSSAFMKIRFGRPDLASLVKDFHPEEVYYCGGQALKEKLSDVCRDAQIAFHPEDFDAGGGGVVKGIHSFFVDTLWGRLCGKKN